MTLLLYKAIWFAIVLYIGIYLGEKLDSFWFFGVMLSWIALQSRYKTHALIVALVFFILNVTAIQGYTFLTQAERFVDQELLDVIATDDFHVLRFFVSYPAIVIGNLLNIDLDQAYTYYGTFYMVGCLLILIAWIHRLPIARQYSAFTRFYIIVMPVFIVLAIMIHGRIAPSYFGMFIILYLQVEAMETKKISFRFVIGHLLAAFLSTVSSGTFAIVFGQELVGGGLLLIACRGREKVKIIASLALLFLYFPHLLAGIEKNLNFFDGSIFNMLTHGAGKFISYFDTEILILVFLFGILLTFLLCSGFFMFYRKFPNWIPILISVVGGAVGGLFGFLTGTMILPGLFAGTVLFSLYKSKAMSASIREIA